MQTNDLKLLQRIAEAVESSSGAGPAATQPQTPVNGTVAGRAEDIVTANPNRTAIFIHNHGESSLKLNFGADVALNSAIYQVDPGMTLVEDTVLATLRISALATPGTTEFTFLEVIK